MLIQLYPAYSKSHSSYLHGVHILWSGLFAAAAREVEFRAERRPGVDLGLTLGLVTRECFRMYMKKFFTEKDYIAGTLPKSFVLKMYTLKFCKVFLCKATRMFLYNFFFSPKCFRYFSFQILFLDMLFGASTVENFFLFNLILYTLVSSVLCDRK